MGNWFDGLAAGIAGWFDGLKAEFVLNVIEKDRWKLLLEGLGNTLLIAFFACLIGIVIGLIIALVNTTWEGMKNRRTHGFGWHLMRLLSGLCRLYVTVIRGTPAVVQLLIMYFVIFAASKNGTAVATFSFGVNSGAYVAEIFRSGIQSVDKGQTEAGRSLGLNYAQTMICIIAPQMLKNVLPTLANEFITLLKETSVAGYVAVRDLTFAGNRIRGITYSPFMPLIIVALVYLVIVIGLSKAVGVLERRLRQSDIR